MPLWLALLLAVAAWQGWQHWQRRAVDQADGVLAPQSPRQGDTTVAPFVHDGHTLTPRAEFAVEARLLSQKRYRFDREARLSPMDFALGWGAMSDNAVLEELDISQSSRFFWWRYENEPPLPVPEVVRSAANMHLIPADASVERQLARMRPGQVVALKGLLVNATADNGWQWNSSLTREDTGAGACELFWVESATVTQRGR
jgi:hypothetical protein